ncbi:techylectin-5A [Trichonephila clavata]|uniref:Techylectin-5A n=1 Tax=Trichonephila clavata TaxID=2740835 RepID=A0A8X6FB13_TRICU|nr:techylectin-5A [Trichonephila clavata]
MITKAKHNLPVCPTTSQSTILKPVDCEEVLRSGQKKSGVYTIWPRSRVTEDRPLEVFCDMKTDEGGWTVVQRRGNFSRPKNYFNKDWASYKKGFGDIEKDFWLGNDNIYALTNQRLYSIRFDLTAWDGEKKYALYDTFWIDNENNKYTLHISDYSGNAGDSMMDMFNNQIFNTRDQNNVAFKEHCVKYFLSGWWNGLMDDICFTEANLNGEYLNGPYVNRTESLVGIAWRTFRFAESLMETEMKIRPKNFRRKRGEEDVNELKV